MQAPVDLSVQGEVLVITVNRPEVRNAIDASTSLALAAAVDTLEGDESLRVGVLTGAGGVFSSGGDLDAFDRGEGPYVDGRGFAGMAERLPTKPLVAAIEGYALAGGLELALCCDVLVAGRSARLGIPEVRHGLLAADGGLLRLRERLPFQLAMMLALTGDDILAERAQQVGLVSEVVDDGAALAASIALAERIAANAPLAVLASKEILRVASDWPVSEAFQRQAAITGPVLASDDAREGVAAFAQRRHPRWTGR